MKKKLISLLLSISVILSSASFATAAEEGIIVDDISVDAGTEYVTSVFNSEEYLDDDTDLKELEEHNIERLNSEDAEKQNALIPYRYEGEFDSIPEIEFISDDIEDGLAQSIENANDDGEITANRFEAAVNSSKYDSRNYGIVSRVKDQGLYGTCWAHSALSEVETAVLKNNRSIEPDYSERHLAYFAYHDGSDKVGLSKGVTSVVSPTGISYLNLGGNDLWASSRLMNSMGAASETAYPYSKVTTAIPKDNAQDYSSYVSGYYFVPTSNATIEQKIETIKSLITQFGVVGWAYCSENAYYTYNSDSTAYYCNLNARTNHAITVVGWDDDYSRYNFKSSCRPKYDGAFLCKNSWGTNWGKNGYFYISYYDATLGNGSNASVVTADKLDFDNNYYYTNAMPLSMCSVSDKAYQYFTVTGETVQTLTAVSFMAATTNMPYSIQIYKNPVTSKPESGQALLSEEVSGVTGYVGYYSVDIPNVELNRGDVFVVAIKCNGYLYADSSFSFSNYKYVVNPTAGISFSGSTDIGKQGVILRINALTLNGSVSDDSNDDAFEDILIEEIEATTTKKQIDNCRISLAGNGTYEYTGYSVRPEITVYSENNEKLIENTDYIVRYKNNRNSYEYYPGDEKFDEAMAPCVEITGKGDYEGKKSIYFAIKGKKNESGTEVVNIPMSKVKIELSKAVTYTGGDITIENNPEDLNVVLSYMDIPLTEYDRESGRGDYAVSYEKNVKAGTATITFVGKGVYTGSVKKKFKINPYKISADDSNIAVYMGDEFVYEKGGVKPLVEVYFKGELLKMGTDYILSYKNNLNANDAASKSAPTIMIRGKGNFTGTINRTFTISKKDLKNVEMNAPGKLYANRKGANISVPVLVDTNGKKLSKGKDYDKITYTYVEDTEVTTDPKNSETIQRYAGEEVLKNDILKSGTKVLVTVTGKGNYLGENSTEYTIYSVSIAKAKISIAEKVYNGNAVTVGNDDISVTYNGETLIEGADYKIIGYTNNLKPGTAKVTIWGTGEFGASKTVTFKIVK